MLTTQINACPSLEKIDHNNKINGVEKKQTLVNNVPAFLCL